MKEHPLLVIEVDDIKSVPKVWYQGIKVEGKKVISYEWETRELDNNGVHDIFIKHVNKEDLTVRTIGVENLKTGTGRERSKEETYDCVMCGKGVGSRNIPNCYNEQKKVCVYCFNRMRNMFFE